MPGCEHEEPIAGEGAPLVAEFCLAELGTVLGISTTSAKKLVGHALELRHRLPRLWAQVQAGRVPAWRARSVAEATIHTTPALTREAAAFVDAQVAAVAGRVGPAQLDRLVAEAIKRYDLAGSTRPRIRRTATSTSTRATPRSTTTTCTSPARCGSRPSSTSPTPSTSTGPSPTAPRPRKALGSDESLDARRAAALGDLARTQTALDLHAGAGEPTTSSDLPAAREVVLHAHFDATLDGLTTVFGPTGRMEEGQRLVLLDQVKDWCGDSRTKVTIKPVIDLNADLSTPAYEVPDRIREQVILRDRTCVFPWCTRPARGCDIDHVDPVRPRRRSRRPTPARPHPDRQPRRAVPVPPPPQDPHRLALPDDRARGASSGPVPHGHRYRRDRHGTTAIDPPDPPGIPRPRRP